MLSLVFRWDETKIDNVLHQTESGLKCARGAILGLLTVSLPAITSISLKSYVWRDEFWMDSLKSITNQQDSFLGTLKPNFLMNVSELNLDDQKGSHLLGMRCSILPFVSLSSLRVIRGASIEFNSFDDDYFANNHGLSPSPVTEIDLQNTTLLAHELNNVIRSSQVLKRFRYDRDPQSDLIRYGAEPSQIIKAVLERASHSLESLVVTGAFGSPSYREENIEGSLRSFKVLKEIHLPSAVFLACPSYAHGVYQYLPTEAIPRLVDVLPPSIETVRLDGKTKWERFTALLIGLPADRMKCLPKLKEIFFTVGGKQGKAPKALAHLDQKHGMVLELDKATGSARAYSGRLVF